MHCGANDDGFDIGKQGVKEGREGRPVRLILLYYFSVFGFPLLETYPTKGNSNGVVWRREEPINQLYYRFLVFKAQGIRFFEGTVFHRVGSQLSAR